MERSRKLALTLTGWIKANDALNLHFEGNKSELTKHLEMSRTTVTAFFNQKPVREAGFRKICLALRLNWQEVSAVEVIATNEDDWVEEVRSRCCEKILYQHGTIRLLNDAEIGVDQLYVDVWLLNRSPRTFQVSGPTMLRSFDLRNDRLGLGDRIKRNEGMAVAHDNARLLILGKPGAGKTTFLKHLAVDCSKGEFQPNLIPVLIELRKIRSTEWKLLDALSEELSTDNQQTQTLLEQGRLLILMDGLDEVPSNSFRHSVQEQLRSLGVEEQLRDLAQERKYSGNRFIVTCRTQIIDVIPQGFTSVEVADFDDEQVKKFVENWFCASGRNEGEIAQQGQAFSDATRKNPALKELTVTPVLLSLMCLVLQDVGDLPSQITWLYRKGIRLLLEKWNGRKEIPGWEIGQEIYRKLEPEQKEALLTEIAARKFENSSNFLLFDQKDLAQQIANHLNLANVREGEAVLKAIEAQHGLLVERADEIWSFSNLTFQEYFAIQWLTQLSSEQLADKIADRQWQEVIKQLVQSQPADRLLQLIKRSIDYSVSQDAKLQAFLTWVQEKSEAVNAPYNPPAIRAFYFALVLDIDYVPDFALDRALDSALDSALDFTRPLDSALELDRTLPLKLDFTLDHTLPFALDFALKLTLNHASTSDPIFSSKLAKLRTQLPECSVQKWDLFQHWWEDNSQSWIAELHQVTIEHRNLGHNWQFTPDQKQTLQHYYAANTFLVELLKQDGAVGDRIRQEIEDNLLLPIAELKRRLPDHYS